MTDVVLNKSLVSDGIERAGGKVVFLRGHDHTAISSESGREGWEAGWGHEVDSKAEIEGYSTALLWNGGLWSEPREKFIGTNLGNVLVNEEVRDDRLILDKAREYVELAALMLGNLGPDAARISFILQDSLAFMEDLSVSCQG